MIHRHYACLLALGITILPACDGPAPSAAPARRASAEASATDPTRDEPAAEPSSATGRGPSTATDGVERTVEPSSSFERGPSTPAGSAERAAEPSSASDRGPSIASDRAPSASVPAAPESGCAFGAPVLVEAEEGWADIAAARGAFVVAGTAGESETAFVARLDLDGTVRTIARASLDHAVPPGHRRAAPALATRGSRIAFALADGRRHLLLAELDADRRGTAIAWRTVAEGASLRFAPALAAFGERWALAWTVEDDDSSRVRATLVGDPRTSVYELRPAAGGAVAPSFVAGSPEPVLVFLDPRAAMSVAHRVSVSASGFGTPSVARPLNLVAQPPEIAAARAGSAEWIAFTAVGTVATSAVGLARLDASQPPVALIPGTGYGTLHVGVASLGEERAVFVADAPQAAATGSARELHVRVLARDGALGEPSIVRGPSGHASRGRIAHAGGGIVAVAFTTDAGIHAAVGRCAEAR